VIPRAGWLALALALALGACATHAPLPPECTLGGEPYQRTELYFGLLRPGGRPIEPTTFDVFVEEYVLTQLPTGFTLLHAEGRWVSDEKDILEPSRVLIVLHHGDPATDDALQRIRARYKELFAQQSVLRVDSRACARF
jgi:hypothetical protein